MAVGFGRVDEQLVVRHHAQVLEAEEERGGEGWTVEKETLACKDACTDAGMTACMDACMAACSGEGHGPFNEQP